MRDFPRAPVVAIIGGGFSGANIALHLAQASAASPAAIVVFEPREKLGAGLAYDTDNPAHRINVPASRMSPVADDPDHFSRWIADNTLETDDPDALAADGHLYPRRQLFGEYIHSMVHPFVEQGDIVHRRTAVVAVERFGDRWHVIGADGEGIDADIVIVATSHPAPSAPEPLASVLTDHPRFVVDPTSPGALDVVAPDHRILIVGNGLTSADIIATLVERGHRGAITSISRRGLRSRGHAAVAQEPYGEFRDRPATTALSLLKRVRSAIREAQSAGLTWHPVIDAVRAQGQDIWKALPLGERKRLVRHLRPYWDVHRFRIAPQVENVVEAAITDRQLTVLAASLADVTRSGETIKARLRLRHTGTSVESAYDAVIVTTGPAHGGILKSQGWLAELADRGLLASDPTGLGLSCDRGSRALDRSGVAVPGLYIAGPLARGTFGELMGLPQVSEHASFVAGQVAEVIARTALQTELASTAA